MIFKKITDMIGHTPLIRLDKAISGYTKLHGKLESLNPGGSIKDRAALWIIRDAYESGLLSKGQAVVEMTSGNMGAGLAVVCKQYGNPFTAVMPRGNSPERIKILKALGASVILTDQVDGEPGMVTGSDIDHAIMVANEIAKDSKAFYVDQFYNPSSVRAHFGSTGPEIYKDLPDIDVFITAIGSGGTFIGVTKFLKMKNRNIKCIGVEPENAAIIKTGSIINPRHIIQGTGYGRIPYEWDENLANDIITVSDEEVAKMTRKLSREMGLYVGYSSGANVAAAEKYINSIGKNQNIVVILPDTAYKYTDI